MSAVNNGSVQIHTETFGSTENDPVLLIAGAMAPAVFWETQFCIALAERGYHVIQFDNRDMGGSTHFPQSAPESGIELPYTINDMVADARCVLDTLSGKKGHIIGHSLGGSIAQLFAVTYPEKTASVTAIASPILAKGDIAYVETDPKITEALWAVLMSNPMHQEAQKGVPAFRKIWRVLNGDWPLDENMADAYTRTIYATETIGPAWNHTHVQNGIRDILKDLKMLNVPLLFIQGEKDYLPCDPQNTAILAQHLPDAEFVKIPNGGHMFFNTDIWRMLFELIVAHIKVV